MGWGSEWTYGSAATLCMPHTRDPGQCEAAQPLRRARRSCTVLARVGARGSVCLLCRRAAAPPAQRARNPGQRLYFRHHELRGKICMAATVGDRSTRDVWAFGVPGGRSARITPLLLPCPAGSGAGETTHARHVCIAAPIPHSTPPKPLGLVDIDSIDYPRVIGRAGGALMWSPGEGVGAGRSRRPRLTT